MTKTPDVVDVLRDLAVLYELSLSVGRSIDFGENCDSFLEKLMARKSLDFASVWIRRELSPEYQESDGAATDFVLAYANPSFRAAALTISENHALAQCTQENTFVSVSHGEDGFQGLVTETGVDRGTFAVYRLGEIGLLKLYSMTRNTPYTAIDLGKLRHVVDKFTVSIEGCLDHARLTVHERRRKELEQKMQHAQKLESLGLLAGGVAHDFNNLLTAILGNAEMTKLRPETADASFENIIAAATRAGELCSQLLAYSGRGKFVIESLELDAVVDEMLRLAAVTMPKNARVVHDRSESTPAIDGDPSQIRQVVLNLLTNAAEALGDEGGEIQVRTGVWGDGMAGDPALFEFGTLQKNKQYVFLEVEDTGCGMAETDCAKIFDPFYTTKFTGRGLGLAAVLGIVRGYEGAIQVQSDEGKGTCVRVILPASQYPVLSPEEPEQIGAPSFSGTVLVIDDEAPVRAVLQQVLSHFGFEVETAEDGGEGLRMFEAQSSRIDLVVLDLTMPVLGGEEVLTRIRRTHPQARVIVTSGYSESESQVRCLEVQPSAFLAKPFQASDVERAVRIAFADPSSVRAEK